MSWINKLAPWTTSPKPFANDEAAQQAALQKTVKVTPPAAQTIPQEDSSLIPPLEIEVRKPFVPVPPEQPPPLPPLNIGTEPVVKEIPAVPQVTVAPPLPIQKQRSNSKVAAVLVAGAVAAGGYMWYNNTPSVSPSSEVAPPSATDVQGPITKHKAAQKAAISTPDKIDLSCTVVNGQLPPVQPPVEPPKPVPAPEPPKPPAPAPVPAPEPPKPVPAPPPAPVPPTPVPEPAAQFEPGTVLYGFKGLGGIFDEAAFKQFAEERGLVPVVIKNWDTKAAINEFVTLQKDFKTPFALYGFSIGGQTAVKTMNILDALAKNNKPSAQPVAVFTIGTSTIVNFKGAFDNVKVVEHYFHFGTKHDVTGTFIKAPHVGKDNIQQAVADMFKKGK